jgi:hypothetical protein
MKYATVKAEWVIPLNTSVDQYQNVADGVIGDIRSMDETAKDIRVHIQPMPPEYNRMMSDSDEAKERIESDTDRGFSLGDCLMGGATVRHPHDDGMWIFPEDHPLSAVERMAAAKGDHEVLNELQAAAPKLKELPSGEGNRN